MKFVKFLKTAFCLLFLKTTLVPASIDKIDQKKQKDILRKDIQQIFLLKHNDAKKHYKI